MKIKKALVSTGLAVLTTLALTPSASAAYWDYTMRTTDPSPSGVAKFKSYGDVLRLCDEHADGYSAHVVVSYVSSGRTAYRLKASGGGECKTVRARNIHYDLKDGQVIKVRVYLWSTWSGEAKFSRTYHITS